MHPTIFVVSHACVVDVNQEPFRALADAGATVRVVAPRRLSTDVRGEIVFAPLRGFEGSVRAVPLVSGGYSRALGGQRGIHLIVYRNLGRLLRAARPDLVYAEEEPFSFASLQASRLARRAKLPFVFHANQNVDKPLPAPFGVIRRIVFSRAAGATARNHAAAELLRTRGFAGPIEIFPHAVDLARYTSEVRVAQDVPRPVVGFVGRLVPEKGVDDLVDAVAMLGTGSLLVVGDGPERDALEKRAAGLGVGARFLGAVPHDDVPRIYAGMDVVAVPSRTTPGWKEQFGRIVIEANAAGVPVVASDSGELPATVAATGGGVVFPEGDVAALAEALGRLAGDADAARSLGENGRRGVEARFTPGAVGSRLLTFLLSVIRDGGSR